MAYYFNKDFSVRGIINDFLNEFLILIPEDLILKLFKWLYKWIGTQYYVY